MDLPATPSFRLDGRRALVTGAGRGLGAAMATALAEAGAAVTALARTEAEVAALAAALTARGFDADSVALDVTDTAAFDRFIEAEAPFEVLVNNAGTTRLGSALSLGEDDFDAVMALNVRAAYFVARAVARRLVADGRRGSIINVSSQMGHVGGTQRSLYCASKFAMEGFTKTMALEFAPHAIRVNTLCPTFIDTPLTRPFLSDPEIRASVLSRIPLGRIGDVTDVMGPVLFLASDASSLMTGSALMIDGGWTAV